MVYPYMKRVFVAVAMLGFVLNSVAVGQPTATISAIPARYENDARRIIEAARADSLAFDRLTYLVDTFGPRLSGSDNLEHAIDWILREMTADQLDEVRGEPVMVPHWVRGEESLQLLAPRQTPMAILGLGGSIGTPDGGTEAEVLVVGSYDELSRRRDEARGKIVVYNVPFTTYGETVQYRSSGAIRAAEAGAVASLVRSVTPHSLYTPHTGMMRYDPKVRQIPHAAITVEDAMLLQRLQDRGTRTRLRLRMEAHQLPDRLSRNVVAELRGTEKPDEIVVMGCHIDSWDVGQGAMDDAGGCVATWEALRLLKTLGLRPRRTIRVVFWANEENGLRGATAYRDTHREELDHHVLAIETDAGVFKPTGYGFSGTPEAMNTIRAIARLLEPIGAGTITAGGGGADIGPIMQSGVPGMGLSVAGEKYFFYHHSAADTLDKLNPEEVNLCIATLAVMAYVVADLPERLPRQYSTGGATH